MSQRSFFRHIVCFCCTISAVLETHTQLHCWYKVRVSSVDRGSRSFCVVYSILRWRWHIFQIIMKKIKKVFFSRNDRSGGKLSKFVLKFSTHFYWHFRIDFFRGIKASCSYLQRTVVVCQWSRVEIGTAVARTCGCCSSSGSDRTRTVRSRTCRLGR